MMESPILTYPINTFFHNFMKEYCRVGFNTVLFCDSSYTIVLQTASTSTALSVTAYDYNTAKTWVHTIADAMGMRTFEES